MSRRQIKKIYPGTIYYNRKFNNLKNELLKENDGCVSCGNKKDLEPHHIVPCHVHDKLFFKKDNIAILCRRCHNYYHQNYFPIGEETFQEFLTKFPYSTEDSEKPKKKKYERKKYESHPEYSKIKINDFRKEKKSKSKPKKKKKKKKRRINPIFIDKELGSDSWDYQQDMEIEREVLGDYYEK